MLPPIVPKGYSPVKNTQKGYAFLYPFGWQEVSVDGAEVTYKDIIEPLESVSLEILPSAKQTISEYGELNSLAETLVKEVLVPPTQEGKVLAATKVSERKTSHSVLMERGTTPTDFTHTAIRFVFFLYLFIYCCCSLNIFQRENEGVEYYTIEYVAKSRVFVRHSLTTLAVARGKEGRDWNIATAYLSSILLK